MHTLLKPAVYLLLITFLASACKEKNTPPAPAKVELQVQHFANGQPLERDKAYTSPAGNTYTVQKLRFYLSNVKLISQDGRTVYAESDSYHLITLDGKDGFSLEKVPAALYTKIEFAIGVDEARNHSIDQFGDLDPSNDMVWDWNTGYKFLLLEGLYSTSNKSGGLVLHVGEDSNYQIFTLDLPQPLDLRQQSEGRIVLSTEVNELFQNPHPIDFDVLNTAMSGENARKIVENYSNGFIKATQVE